MANPRRQFLLKAVNFYELKGLEIGPLNEPLVRKEDIQGEGQIFYLDHLPTDQLKEKYQDDNSVDVDSIVDVDFVCRNGNMVEATGGELFDYIVASHVIEHAPNLLQFLTDVQAILKPGGHCILIIPDKRFTFDLNRPVTTFGTVLENFLTNIKIPRISAVYDQAAMAVNANGHNLWHGIVNAQDNCLLDSEPIAWEVAHQVHAEPYYHDVHVNIFTPESFFGILKKSIVHELVLFQVKDFLDTQIGQIEFMVRLQKPQDNSNNRQKSKCLESFPTFQIESLLSPYMPQVKALSAALQSSCQNNLELRRELEEVRNEHSDHVERLLKELKILQNVVDRKSVKLVLWVIDKLYSKIRKN